MHEEEEEEEELDKRQRGKKKLEEKVMNELSFSCVIALLSSQRSGSFSH